MDISQQIKELREQLNKLEQQQCCHDWEVFACGCKRCKKCGLIIREYQSWITTDWGNDTTINQMQYRDWFYTNGGIYCL